MKQTFIPIKKVVIQVPAESFERFKHYAKKMQMTVKKVHRDNYEVGYLLPIDLYFLGANMGMQPFKTGVAQHV